MVPTSPLGGTPGLLPWAKKVLRALLHPPQLLSRTLWATLTHCGPEPGNIQGLVTELL